MSSQSGDLRLLLTDAELELLVALSRFGATLIEFDKDPRSLAVAALAFSAVGFASYLDPEEFAQRSGEYYETLKANLEADEESGILH